MLLNLNIPEAAYPNKTIHRLFEEQVEKNPQNIAVVFGSESLTYYELNERANKLAEVLRNHGVKPDFIVALLLNRSIEMVIGILAILKAGGAYLPIDSEYPNERIKYMLGDSQAKVILSTTELIQKNNFSELKIEIINLSEESAYQGDGMNLNHVNRSTDLAYIIYTSGSTGEPKGVMIEHCNVVSLLYNDRFQFDFGENDVWTLFHTFSFDFSVWEMYGALLYGGKLVIIPKLSAQDPKEYLKILKKEKVTVLNQTPTAFYSLIEEELSCSQQQLNLRYVIFGGEALKPMMLKKWYIKYPNVKLINMYGITETTVHVTYHEITPIEIEKNISNIGKPIPTLNSYLLDRNLRVLPQGVIGEICVGGAGLSRGYLNRPDLTMEKFIDNPYIPGEKLYRSGDLARVLTNGDLEYIGRKDNQVKIRGHRIELVEIETQILKHGAVKQIVVVVKPDTHGNKFLCAYIVVDGQLSMLDLRSYLLKKLPEYMIPLYFMKLESLPMTSNGKINLNALPELDNSSGFEENYEAPQNELETKLVQVWQELLNVEKVGVNDNYFSLGGDSIKAIRLINRMNKELAASIQMKDLYIYPTIKELASNMKCGIESEIDTSLKKGLEIIEKLKQKITADVDLANYLPNEWEDFYPLSQIQQGMVFYSQLKPDEPIYQDQFIYFFNLTDLDFSVYCRALELLMNKHPILRTTFDVDSFSEPLQFVHKGLLPDIAIDDITGLSLIEQEEQIKSYLRKDLDSRFKFTGGLLWRIRIFKLSDQNYCNVSSFHHAIIDGWSEATFNTELLHIYHECKIDPLFKPDKIKSSYKEYIAVKLGQQKSFQAQDFWKQMLKGCVRNKLPFNMSGKKIADTNRTKICNKVISGNLLSMLEEKALKYKCTLKDICLSAYLYLLSIITTDQDIVTGVVTHDRPLIEDGEKILGCFLNTLPIRVNIDYEMNKFTLLDYVKNYLNTVKTNELFLAEIASAIGEVNYNGNPIFDTIFNFVDFHVVKDNEALLKSGHISRMNLEKNEMTNTLFDMDVSKTLNKFLVRLKYATSYFNAHDINIAIKLYVRILEKYADDNVLVLRRPDLLSEDEKQQLICDFNNTVVEYEKAKTIHQLFEEQVIRTPDNIALKFETRSIKYNELNARANQLARVLIEKGVKPGKHVGLVMQRSIEMVIGMLAILKCGAAYVPIDPQYPSERKEYIINNSNVTLILVDNDYQLQFECVSISSIALEQYSKENLDVPIESTNLAYVIYTSGSTGLPKGVMIEHHSVVNLLRCINKNFQVDEKDIVLCVSSICFDLSVYDIFGLLASGGKVVIAKKEQVQDLDELKNLLLKEKITIWDSVPTTINSLVKVLDDEKEPYQQEDLRLVLLSGDWIPVKLPEAIKQYFRNSRVISLGGATEGTVWSIYYPIEKVTEYQTSIPYGKPLANNYFYILDQNLDPVPQGVVGELYIGGVGVARGYINDAERTKKSFIKNRFLDSEIEMMYKTGDLGRMLTDGNIEFWGRQDHQVKIRGYRVELGEIEQQLLKHELIKDAVVVDRLDTDGNKYLCAYLVVNEELALEEIKGYLAQKLPEYMIPSYYVFLDKLPLSSNGKVDRKALPENVVAVKNKGHFEAPKTDLEEGLVSIWQEILRIDKIGISDNFFELGAFL